MLPSGHTTQTPIGAKGNKLSKCWSLIGFQKSTVSDPLTSGRLNSHVLVCFVETETFFFSRNYLQHKKYFKNKSCNIREEVVFLSLRAGKHIHKYFINFSLQLGSFLWVYCNRNPGVLLSNPLGKCDNYWLLIIRRNIQHFNELESSRVIMKHRNAIFTAVLFHFQTLFCPINFVLW